MTAGEGQPFSRAADVVLDASGSGQVEIAPPGVTWTITQTSVLTSTRVKEPTFRLYLDAVSPAAFLEGTYSGSQDSSDTTRLVHQGSRLIGVWTGGDPGARATLRIAGTYT